MFILLDLGMFALGKFRQILFFIERVGLFLVELTYNLMFSASEAFKADGIKDLAEGIAKNMYVIVGIFALFRIGLILVNSIIDPEKLTDKKQGVGNVAMNLVITMALFIIVPMVFNMSRDAQTEIMRNNYIPKLLIGGSFNTSEGGKYVKTTIVRALIKPESEFADVDETAGTVQSHCSGDCNDAVQAWQKDEKEIGNYLDVYENGNNGNTFVYDYHPFLILVVSIVTAYVFLSFSIDIAVRSIELLVLQIMSPIFIVTYIDPNSSKNGPFKKWLSTCGKTYASLYIKLAVVYFMILLLGKLTSSDLINPGAPKILLIIAILIFAKKAPKWIGDMFGVEDGIGGLGIGKKIGGMALAGGLATKAGHAAAGMGIQSLRNARAARKAYKSKLRDEGDTALGRAKTAANGKKGFDKIKSAAGSYFSPKENAKNLLRNAKAGALGFGSGISVGAKAGWDANDMKDLNAKTKLNASGKLEELNPNYSSLGERAKDKVSSSKIGQLFESRKNQAIDDLYGTGSERIDAAENKEKIAKSKDMYPEPSIENGKRDANKSPVGIREWNKAAADLKIDNSSKEGLAAVLAINNAKDGQKITYENGEFRVNGVLQMDGNNPMSPVKYCQDNRLLTAYGTKEMESIAHQNAVSKVNEYQSAKDGVEQAKQTAAKANAQVIEFQANVKAVYGEQTLSALLNLEDSIKSLGDNQAKLAKAEKERLQAQQEYDKVKDSEDEKKKQEAKTILDYATNQEVLAKATVDAIVNAQGLQEKYSAVKMPVEEANSSVNKFTQLVKEKEEEIKRQVAAGNDLFNVENASGVKINIIDNYDQADLIKSIMEQKKSKAASDAEKLKPKHDK